MAVDQLPPDMILAYKQYKKDTETVAGWLAEHAAQAGYQASTATANATDTKEPKLKGRARKLARDAAKQHPQAGKAKCKYTVKTAEFVVMAKRVAVASPKIILRRAMQSLWRRAIRARRGFGEWFKTNVHTDSFSDEKHCHFANVLETALHTLQPCYELHSEDKHDTKKEQEKSTNIHAIENIFQHLELKEPLSEEEMSNEQATPMAKGVVTTAPRARIDFDKDEAESEFLFAIWTYLQDLMAVRVYVRSTWVLYATGVINLMQASSVTNLAIDLARRGEADFEASLQRPTKYPAAQYPTGLLPFLIFVQHLPYTNGGPLEFDPDTPGSIVICGCELCGFLLYIPYIMAKSYIDVMKTTPPTFPTSNNDNTVKVPAFPGVEAAFKAKYYHAQNPSQLAQTQLSEILPNSVMLCLMLRRTFIEDEILHAARHIVDNHNVPLWVSFAYQIQLDIQQAQVTHSFSAFEDVKKSYRETKCRYEEHDKWHKSLSHDVWDKSSNNHVLDVVEEFGQWIEGSRCGKADPVEIYRRIDSGQTMEEAMLGCPRVPLLANFPVTCGSLKTEMQLEWNVLGLRLVNHTGHLTLLCHVYNALRAIDPTCPVWPDMELVIRNQTPEKIFIGGRPSTALDAHKRMMLAMGYSSTNSARDARGMRMNRKNFRQREFASPAVCQNLFERWLGKETRKIDEAAFELQQLLYSEKYKPVLEQALLFPFDLEAHMSGHAQKPMSPLPKMIQTLSKLSLALVAEMPAFMFDYFSMTRRCYEIYRHINEKFLEHVGAPRHLLASKETDTNCPVSVTTCMFQSAVTSEAFNQFMRTNKSGHKAIGPGIARKIRAMMPETTNAEQKGLMEDVLGKVKAGRGAEVMGTMVDLAEHASAKHAFNPALKAIENMISRGEGDAEIRKLREMVNGSNYGAPLFQVRHLNSLYGGGMEAQWQGLVIPDNQLKDLSLARAENPTLLMLNWLFINTSKKLRGVGRDGAVENGCKEVSAKAMEELQASRQMECNQTRAIVESKDWESLSRIYGRQGRNSTR